MSKLPQLVYFNIRGRGECIRLLFHAAGQPFEDTRIAMQEWQQKKPETPYNQLPYYVQNGKKHGQGIAIGQYIARKHGLYGKTPEDALRVDEVTHLVDDYRLNVRAFIRETDQQKKAEAKKKAKEEATPYYLGLFEKLLSDNDGSGFFVSNSVSFADLTVYDILETMVCFDPELTMTKYPVLQKLQQNVENVPSIKKYLSTRPASINGF